MQIRPQIQLKINGLNQENAINTLHKKEIKINDYKKIDYKTSSFRINKKHFKVTTKVLNNNSINIIESTELGGLKIWSLFIKNIGLFIGLVIGIIVIGLLNQFIYKIEIYGNKTISKDEIIQFLETKSIKPLTSKNTINNQEIEMMILENYSNTSLVSVIKKGCSLIVNIKEKNQNENNSNSKFKSIYSQFNGRITSIEHSSGTLLKNVGDIVKIGDKIVGSYYIDKNGEKKSIEAKAIIYADIWLESSYIHSPNQVKAFRTGNKYKVYNISFFGNKIFESNNKVNYENYEIEQSERSFTNTVLPIKISYETYYEIDYIEENIPFESVKQEIFNKTRKNALQFSTINDIIIKEDFTINEISNQIKVTCIITINKKIS